MISLEFLNFTLIVEMKNYLNCFQLIHRINICKKLKGLALKLIELHKVSEIKICPLLSLSP